LFSGLTAPFNSTSSRSASLRVNLIFSISMFGYF
jgi:hypothetical protein